MSTKVDTDTTERLARNDDDYLYGWQGTTNYRMKVSVLLAGYVQGEGVASGNYVLSGGGVVWEQDYDYTVSAASYVIQGAAYSSPETPITLTAADATNDRIDIIAVDTAGDVVVLTGTPAANPQAPAVDPDTQLQLTFVYVAALSTDPGVTTTVLYQENAGTPTEWTYTDSGATLSGADTAQPFAGTTDIAGTSCVNGDQFILTAAAPISLTDQNFLNLRVRPNGTWPGAKSLRLVWRSSGVVVGNVVTLANGTYGLNTGSATYQTIAIPIADFGVSGTVDSLRVRVNGGGAAFSFYVDNIELQSGLSDPGTAYQPLDSDLTAIAALAPSNDDVIQRKAGAWTNRTMAQLATDLTATNTWQPLDSDLTTIAGLTATTDNFMQAKSSAWASRTPAQVTTDLQGTGLAADTVGFRGIPQVTFSAATTIAATHEGKDLVHPASDANARTITIDSNANLALPVGFAFSGYNDTSQAVTIAITADTLVWIGTGGTGSRTVAQYGSWVCRKIDTTRWVISGVNIT
jgi:hypothetical protein